MTLTFIYVNFILRSFTALYKANVFLTFILFILEGGDCILTAKLKGNRPFKPLFSIWSPNTYSNTFQSPTDCNSSEIFNVTQESILTDVVCLSLKVFQENAHQMHPIYAFIKFQIHRINISRCSLLLFYFFPRHCRSASSSIILKENWTHREYDSFHYCQRMWLVSSLRNTLSSANIIRDQ